MEKSLGFLPLLCTSDFTGVKNEVKKSQKKEVKKSQAIHTSTHGWIPKETGVIKSFYSGFLII